MRRIEINFLTKEKIVSVFWLKKKIIKILDIIGKKDFWIEVTVITENRLKKIKSKFLKRKIKNNDWQTQHPPEILSFQGVLGDNSLNYLGELLISSQAIQKNAKANKIRFKEELTIILIHGILHLIGYTHEKDKNFKKMANKEKAILNRITN